MGYKGRPEGLINGGIGGKSYQIFKPGVTHPVGFSSISGIVPATSSLAIRLVTQTVSCYIAINEPATTGHDPVIAGVPYFIRLDEGDRIHVRSVSASVSTLHVTELL